MPHDPDELTVEAHGLSLTARCVYEGAWSVSENDDGCEIAYVERDPAGGYTAELISGYFEYGDSLQHVLEVIASCK